MKKIILLASLALSINAFAQVPSYVPTNGLVGWWPFNGNANDESGIGNNGTVNGAKLTSDRFGNMNKAYGFDGNDLIDLQTGSNIQGNNSRSISSWFTLNNLSNHTHTLYKGGANGVANDFSIWITCINNQVRFHIRRFTDDIRTDYFNLPINQWHSLIVSYDGTNDLQTKIYLDGQLITKFQVAPTGLTYNTSSVVPTFGKLTDQQGVNHYYEGQLDDIAIWNRALNQQEITNLYNGTNITGFNPVTYQNTIKVYPNPTHDHITIDNGNIANLTGYQIKITNSLSQQVFQSAITQQQFYVDLSTWTGNGIYFVHIIDGQGNTIDIKKIVLK